MNAKKEIKHGIKFVYLEGETPYDIGFQHGTILKDEVKSMIDDLTKLSKKNYGLIITAILNIIVIIYSRFLKKTIPEDILAEMKGISDGSGQPIKWAIFTYVIYEIGVKYTNLLKGCSAFITRIGGSNTILLAKTTDFSNPKWFGNFLIKHKVMFVYDCKWLEHKFLVPTFPMCLVGDSLIFDNGVSIGFNDGGSYIKRADFKNKRIVKVQRDLLKGTISSEAIKEKLLRINPIKPYSALVTDGTNEGTYLMDICPEDHYLKKFEDHLINTNLLATEGERTRIYKDNYMEDLHTNASFTRYKNVKDGIENKAVDIESVKKILGIHTDDCDIDKGSIANMGTVHAFIAIPEKREIYLPNGTQTPVNLNGEWIKFSFEEIFG